MYGYCKEERRKLRRELRDANGDSFVRSRPLYLASAPRRRQRRQLDAVPVPKELKTMRWKGHYNEGWEEPLCLQRSRLNNRILNVILSLICQPRQHGLRKVQSSQQPLAHACNCPGNPVDLSFKCCISTGYIGFSTNLKLEQPDEGRVATCAQASVRTIAQGAVRSSRPGRSDIIGSILGAHTAPVLLRSVPHSCLLMISNPQSGAPTSSSSSKKLAAVQSRIH